MLAVAAANLAGPRLVADAHRLPFATGAFDLTVALTLLEFVDDPARVVAELARVTRPGGRLLVAALNRASPWGLAHRRRLRRPPWTAARLLTRGRLRTLGRAHGTARLQAALYAPAAVPGLHVVGPLLEGLGRPLPWLGAYQLLVVDRR